MPDKKKAEKNRKERRLSSIHLSLPATSANLGPAFDAAALAIDLYLTIDARPASDFSIRATGRDAEICQARENNLILTTYCEVLQTSGADCIPLALRIKNEIPIGKGCGSSAAARLAGIALANHFGKMRWTDSQIIGEASRREHHPDNASACWMGGLTVARMPSETEALVGCIRPKGKWPLLLAIPQESLSTAEARRALPAQYSRNDAVANIQNSLLLLAAFTQGRHELLAPALEDRIHQPYRASLCPLLPCLQELTSRQGILGSALSGAGPSVIVFLDPRGATKETRELIARHLAAKGLRAELLLSFIALRGARR
jgi:homoserine kinase